MMAESIQCPNCQQTYPFKAELAGKNVRCAQCGSTFAGGPDSLSIGVPSGTRGDFHNGVSLAAAPP